MFLLLTILQIWGLGLTRLHLFLSGLCLSFIYFSLHGLVGLIIYSHIRGWNYVGTCQTFHWLSTEPTVTLLCTRTQGRASWDCQIQVSRFYSNGVNKSSGVFKYLKRGVWHFKMFYDFFLLFKSSLKPLFAPNSINMAHSANQPCW